MKKLVFSRILFALNIMFFFLSGVFHAHGQNVLKIEPNIFNETYLNIDISNEHEGFSLSSGLSNLGQDTMIIRYKKVIPDECPYEWDFLLSDKYISYLPFVDSNASKLHLLPGELNAFFSIEVKPNMVPGCCDFEVLFGHYDSPGLYFDTITYSIVINDQECQVTSIDDNSIDPVKVFPNPVFDQLNIQTDISYDELHMYDERGRKVHYWKNNDSNTIDLSFLDEGIYLIQLYNSGMFKGQSRFIKL